MSRVCHDCGSMSRDTAFPKRRVGKMPRCCDCEAEAARAADAAGGLSAARPIRTRASYRAAFRHRAQQPQGDLVDLLVPPA
jgi:hypothetical protein